MECLPQQKEIVMLVLTHRSGESLVFAFPGDLDIDPITVTALDNGNWY